MQLLSAITVPSAGYGRLKMRLFSKSAFGSGKSLKSCDPRVVTLALVDSGTYFVVMNASLW